MKVEARVLILRVCVVFCVHLRVAIGTVGSDMHFTFSLVLYMLTGAVILIFIASAFFALVPTPINPARVRNPPLESVIVVSIANRWEYERTSKFIEE